MWSVKMRSPRSGVPADPRLMSSQKGDIRTRTRAHGEDIGEAGGDAAAAEELPGGSRGRGDGPLTSDLRPPDGEAAPFCGRSPAECVTRHSSRGQAEGARCGMNAEARLASARRAGPRSDAPPVRRPTCPPALALPGPAGRAVQGRFFLPKPSQTRGHPVPPRPGGLHPSRGGPARASWSPGQAHPGDLTWALATGPGFQEVTLWQCVRCPRGS